MNHLVYSNYRAELDETKRVMREDRDVAARMSRTIHSAMSGLRTELLELTSELSLTTRDEAEKQILKEFGPEESAVYRDSIVQITYHIDPELTAPERNAHVAEPFRSILNVASSGVK